VYEPDEERLIWDVAAGRMPDGRPFFAGAAATGAVHLVDAESGAALGQPLRGLRRQALTVAVTTLPDGTVLVAAGGESRKILRWNAVTGDQLGEPLTGPRGSVLQLSFDGVLLTATDDRDVTHRWNAVTGEPVDPPPGTVPDDQAVVTLPGGRRLLAAGHADGSITVTPFRNGPSE
jgi:WD40 repeat protein